MKKRLLLIPFIFLLTLTIFSGCSNEKKTSSELIHIFVSIEPQKYFVDRIGGHYIDTEVMVKTGEDPETYEPTPLQISRLGKAKAFFSIGVPFEKSFIEKISNSLPNLNIIDTARGIVKRKITGGELSAAPETDNNPENEEMDPHIWMSPVLVKKQAENILIGLKDIDPAHSVEFESNFHDFSNDLDKVNLEIKDSLAKFKGSIMFVYHPAFGYFADEYGLKQLAIESAGKEPSPRTLENIIGEVLKKHVKVIFVQPEFQSSSIKVITKATGAAVIAVNPLSYDYLDNLRNIANTLEESLGRN